jgi:hypothetical protein
MGASKRFFTDQRGRQLQKIYDTFHNAYEGIMEAFAQEEYEDYLRKKEKKYTPAKFDKKK